MLLRFLLLSAVAFAQTDSWLLMRGIYPGQDTHVHTSDGRKYKGRFISASDDTVVIRSGKGDTAHAKKDIKKVSVRTAGGRWRNAGIGAAIGAVTIGGVAAAASEADGRIVAAAAVGYGLWGGAIGALFPGYKTIYQEVK